MTHRLGTTVLILGLFIYKLSSIFSVSSIDFSIYISAVDSKILIFIHLVIKFACAVNLSTGNVKMGRMVRTLGLVLSLMYLFILLCSFKDNTAPPSQLLHWILKLETRGEMLCFDNFY